MKEKYSEFSERFLHFISKYTPTKESQAIF